MKTPGSLLDRVCLRGMELLPTGFARRLMNLLASFPALADRWGYHVRPIHYYEPFPDYRTLSEEVIRRRREPSAIDFDLAAQLALLRHLAASYAEEVAALFESRTADGPDFENGFFAGLDAAVYYAMVRELKPRRVIEIGSGYSTRLAHAALARNRSEGRAGELVCIEPFPEERLTTARIDARVVRTRIEEVDLELFDSLEENDILFIDSSHITKAGGDVCREYLEILPRLKRGVSIQIHDIFFPYDYPAQWIFERRRTFNEQYLLESFLKFNDAFAVTLANHWLFREHPAAAELLWPASTRPFDPKHARIASFWMKRVA